MKKSTNNYERPEVQVVYVETEAGFASYGTAGAAGAQGDFIIEGEDY